MRLLGRVLIIILAVLGGFALLSSLLLGWAATRERSKALPAHMVLTLDLNAGVAETGSDSPFAKLQMGNGYVLKDVVESLDKASRDSRVIGVVARVDAVHLGMGKTQELRDAIAAFRKSGKRAVIFSSSLGEFGSATVAYYLASAFQEIWLQPSGDIGLTGFMAESPFFKDVLDKLGVEAQFGARYEYKSAIDIFTQKGFTKENRQSMELLINSWTGQVVDGIAQARGLKPDEVKALIDRSPLLADEALQAKLVDRLAYWDELEHDLTKDGAKLVDLDEYGSNTPLEANAVKVALIYGVGTVQRGDGGGALSDEAGFSSERVGKAFRDAVKDKDIKAILFRIDSPGGSYTASDAIWREVGNARAAGKPVVVSMGDVAASGGYFAAMQADRIIAQPGTITGSIGVFSGKFVLAELWKKLGVNWDEVHAGKNAGMWSENEQFSPSAWERMNGMLDHIYGDFTGKAGKARNISPQDMDKLARGRVWPGDEAKRLGLVDENGGYATAFVAIRQLARLPSQMPVNLIQFPRPREPLEVLMELARTGRIPNDMATSLSTQTRLARLAAVVEPLAALLPTGEGTELRMAPIETK